MGVKDIMMIMANKALAMERQYIEDIFKEIGSRTF